MARRAVRLKHWWHTAEWPVVWALGAMALVLGIGGYSRHFAMAGVERSWTDLLYYALQLFVLEANLVPAPIPLALEVARLLAPAVALYTAAQALAIVFRDQLHRLWIRFYRDHIVICGLGTKGALLASSLIERGERVAVVDRDAGNERLERCRDLGARAVVGNATDPVLLRRLGLDHARAIVALADDDGVNAEIALRARDVAGARRTPLTCYVHIVDPRLCALLRQQRLTQSTADYRLEFFNVFESAAAEFWRDIPVERVRHLVVVGLGRMGESIVGHAAGRRAQQSGADAARLRITVIDRDASAKIEALVARDAQIAAACDLSGWDMEVRSPEFERADFLRASDGPDVDCVSVCLDDDARGLAAALTLSARLRGRGVPVVVRVREYAGLASLVERHPGDHLRVFGLLDRTLNPGLLESGVTETLARAIHADYMEAQRRRGVMPAENSSMRPWRDLSERQRESNRKQADHLSAKLRAIGCGVSPLTEASGERFEPTADEIEKLAILEHERWMADHLAEGWRFAPGEKDPARRTHPYLVEWDALPDEARELDRNTARALPAFLAGVGCRIVRL